MKAFLFIILLFISFNQIESKLNVPKLLFPISSTILSSKIMVDDDACFKWESSDEIFITVKPESNNKCSKSCIVSTTAYAERLTKRKSIWITATEQDEYSSKVYRCEVFIDLIDNIQIETVTRTLFKDDIEIIYLDAFDSEGNKFSTLEGLESKWDIESNDILKVISFKDSNFKLPEKLSSIENKGAHSTKILIKALEIGITKITANLIDKKYITSKISSTVDISVHYPLKLDPSHNLFVVVGTIIQFGLNVSSNENIEQVQMPNQKFIWSVSDNSIVSYDQTGLVKCNQIGETTITVSYRDMKGNFASNFINVVEPTSLELKEKNDNKYFVVGRQYTISSVVRDAESNRIWDMSQMNFEFEFDKEIFKLKQHSANFKTVVLQVNHLAQPTLRSRLSEINNLVTNEKIILKTPLSATLDVTIVNPVTCKKEINIPILFQENLVSVQHYDMRAKGGSGNYLWSVLPKNNEVLGIANQNKLVTLNTGTVAVQTVDANDFSNNCSSTIVVSPPSYIKFLVEKYEIRLGCVFEVPITLQAAHGAYFTVCEDLPFKWNIGNTDILSVVQDPSLKRTTANSSCTSVWINSRVPGTTHISVQLGSIKQSIYVTVFEDVQVSNLKGHVDLPLGSTYKVNFIGGPPLVKDRPFFNKLQYNTKKLKISVDETGKNLFLTCLDYHKQIVEVFVGSDDVCGGSQTKFLFRCNPPTRLIIYTNLTQDSHFPSECPKYITSLPSLPILINQNDQVYETSYQITRDEKASYIISVVDNEGNVFDSFDSLDIHWRLDSPSVSFIPIDSTENSLQYNKQFKGLFSLQVDISGYKSDVFNRHSIPIQKLDRIENTLKLIVIPPLRIEPKMPVLYNKKDNNLFIQIRGGSGINKMTFNRTLVRIDYNDSKISVSPVRPGKAFVNVIDKCINQTSRNFLYVNEIRRFDLGGICDVNKLQLLESSKENILTLTLYDNFDSVIEDANILKDIYVKISHSDNIEVLPYGSTEKYNKTDSIHPVRSKYSIKALSVGQATLSFQTITHGGSSIESEECRIQIYPPLRLHPRKLFLLPCPDSSYKLTWTPCPPNSEIIFETTPNSPFSVTETGLVKAIRRGTSHLRAHCKSTSDSNKFFGSDEILVEVDHIDTFKIDKCPAKILVGQQSSFSIIGSNDKTPLSYGSFGLINFKWDLMDKSVASLATTSYRDELYVMGFTTRVLAHKEGVTTLEATVQDIDSCICGENKKIKIEPCRVTVVSPLVVPCPSQFLIPPNSKGEIITNKNSDMLTYSRLDVDGDVSITIDPSGTVTTYDTEGDAFVLVKDSYLGQSAVVKIIVKKVHSIQLLPTNSVNVFPIIPVGGSQEYSVILRDDTGLVFDTSYGVKINFDFDSDQVISIDSFKSNKVTFHALRDGKAVVRAYIESQPTEHFLLVVTGNAILPASPVLHVGATVNFYAKSEVSSDKKKARGFWSSDEIITIDSISGVANSRQVGKGSVYFTHPSSIKTYTNVIVEQVKTVILNEKDSDVVISNIPLPDGKINEKKLSFNLYLSGNSLVRDDEYIKHNVKFKCEILEKKWAEAVALFDNNNHTFSCIIKPFKPKESLNEISSKEAPQKLRLKISVSDKEKTYVVYKEFSFNFLAAFEIVDKPKSIHLNNDDRAYIVSILRAKPSLRVSSNNDRISVSLVQSPKHSDSLSYYSISVNNYFNTDVLSCLITFFDAQTQQKEVLSVSYDSRTSKQISLSKQRKDLVLSTPTNENQFFSLFIILIITSITFFFLWKLIEQNRE
eukprot:TRINITY_DN8632_c0_g1_i1.p1 TRINITY_DN8632_c0_g1~~TRINITY_DN8632_c0_g1_i1.p1  ORF type:complete len:1761 (-),score=503.75 TRINITY_DN8632_c0_g1_i1:6-5288(-)